MWATIKKADRSVALGGGSVIRCLFPRDVVARALALGHVWRTPCFRYQGMSWTEHAMILYAWRHDKLVHSPAGYFRRSACIPRATTCSVEGLVTSFLAIIGRTPAFWRLIYLCRGRTSFITDGSSPLLASFVCWFVGGMSASPPPVSSWDSCASRSTVLAAPTEVSIRSLSFKASDRVPTPWNRSHRS